MTLALGLILVVVALVLLVGEAHLSTGGLLAVGSAFALVGAAVLLALTAGAGPILVLVAAAGTGVGSLGGVVLLSRSLASTRRQRARSGPEAIVGHLGVMRVAQTGAPQVLVDGSLWRAIPSPLNDSDSLHDGDHVIIEQISGLTLSVRRADELELNPWSGR
jgi:membrane protein implicated in regulation of membrane protease activity